MTAIKKTSNSELWELQDLIGELNYQVKRYNHVEEYLPKSFTKAMEGLTQLCAREVKRRDADS